MKLVAKYTLVLAAALTVAMSLLAYYRLERDRAHFEHDMELDHRVVGNVLVAGIADLWTEPDATLDRDRATRRTLRLIEDANAGDGSTRFEWRAGPQPVDASQRVVGHDFVSIFPVRRGAELLGAVVARESLDDVDRLVHADILLSVVGVGLIVLVGLTASFVLGRWLVGRPIAMLVDQARRIGRRDFSANLAFRGADELGELATEMSAMSGELARALAAIERATEARIHAVEQLRHADRLSTVGKLAAGVAHELGTPLSIVVGHSQMISGAEVTGDAALESARAIEREAMRMTRIVRQLLDFSRRKGPEGTTCAPAEIARRSLGLLAPMLDRGAVTHEVIASTPSPRALIDEDSLQQVLTNLIINATQAMPQGGRLTVTIGRAVAAPPETPEAPRPCVRVDVTDTGTGIPDDARDHIFEPFFTTKQPGEGTGLGLAVVYGIVVDHHGWISVDTSARGTSFGIFLQEAPP
jgi:signal transduction histidine kinase